MERRISVKDNLGAIAADAKAFLKSVSGKTLEVSGPGFEWRDEGVHDKTFSGRFRVLWVSAGMRNELKIRTITAQDETGYLYAKFPLEGDMWVIDRIPIPADKRVDDNLRSVFG